LLGRHPCGRGPLTASEINGARQRASAAGLSIETKNESPSLSEIDSWATGAGIILALGVLAMTVGLIRSESAGDLIVLTAAGASSRRSVVTSPRRPPALWDCSVPSSVPPSPTLSRPPPFATSSMHA
jgi:hypothetical protein